MSRSARSEASTTDVPAPYFERASAPGDPPRGRVLLITYSFPPDVHVGALRWQKLVRHFAEHGWGIDVITLDPRDVEPRDASRLRDLPEGLRAFGLPQRVLRRQRLVSVIGSLAALARQGRQNGDVDDQGEQAPGERTPGLARRWLRRERVRLEHQALLEWATAAAELAARLFQRGVHRAVITSGPPHMIHEAGRLVARRTGCAHVMDMRDPWSLRALDESPQDESADAQWLRIATRFERAIVHEARLVVVNTEPFAAAMRDLYPREAPRIIAITNGYDDEPWPDPVDRDRFSIRFAGSIYDAGAPARLMRAIARVVTGLGLQPGDLSLELLADQRHYAGTPLDVVAEQEGVGPFVKVGPVRPRAEALEFLAGASMLVSFPQYSRLAIPAKLFEYVRFHAWLLVMAREGSATELILRGCGADVVEPPDVDAMERVIRERFMAHRAGERAQPLATRGPFSRREQAARLLAALDHALATPDA